MKKVVAALLLACACAPAAAPENPDMARLAARADGVTIVRDSWGIPHIYAATDADAVFGMIYAQAEDDFNRIEVNFMNAMGRLAEAEGEDEIWRDLRMKLFIDPDDMRELYAAAEPWLRDLMDAWADGLNYFLLTNPQVRPRAIDRFEPWMALTFSEGSIGGDIERVSLRRLESLYGTPMEVVADAGGPDELHPDLVEPGGSNGFAIAPSNTAGGNALLLINPHTSFYFRHELHVVSDEGLHAYGAVTWGQFFVYQGFNETAGWMHTSTGADAIDEYYYDVEIREDGVFYPYGDEERQMDESVVTVPYRTATGMADREFTVYRSHHGPIVRVDDDGRWIAVKLMEEPLKALTQSYLRTKAANYDEFKQTMQLHTNSSNNTVFADAEGNIAYFHANFIPIRNLDYDWTAPVTGMTPDTEWQGILAVDDSPNALNPPDGWIQNTNNWPYSVTGDTSPRQSDYAPYVDRYGENARGLHALKVLDGASDFTLETLRDAAYDSYLIAFEPMIPALLEAHASSTNGPLKRTTSEAIELLRGWDLRFGVDSVATAVAIFWGRELIDNHADEVSDDSPLLEALANEVSADDQLASLAAALVKLTEDFGDWRQTPWGEINRFQRLTGDIVQPFDDNAPSAPVGFTSARWGSLAAYGQRTFNDTNRIYGTRGNSFVAVVEFGERLRALAITAGGLNSDPASPHFNDQAERYASGDLRDVYFYREDIDAVAERTYHPGQ
ncbi:MAG: acylase [Acidobacteria bacterium]|nr:acylase [Acidobacteriota bacterium]